MRDSDKFLRDIFLQTQRDFRPEPALQASGWTSGIRRLRSSKSLLMVAAAALMLVSMIHLSVPELLYQGVATTLESYEAGFAAWYRAFAQFC